MTSKAQLSRVVVLPDYCTRVIASLILVAYVVDVSLVEASRSLMDISYPIDCDSRFMNDIFKCVLMLVRSKRFPTSGISLRAEGLPRTVYFG